MTMAGVSKSFNNKKKDSDYFITVHPDSPGYSGLVTLPAFHATLVFSSHSEWPRAGAPFVESVISQLTKLEAIVGGQGSGEFWKIKYLYFLIFYLPALEYHSLQ